MDKEKELNNYSHSVSIIERKNILITGVKKVDSFDKEEFLVETIMGYLALKGEGNNCNIKIFTFSIIFCKYAFIN